MEIAKALSLDNRVLLLDEPTASLTGDEADRLYAIVRKLTATGHAVVLVSHKLEEVFAVADTVTVLRDGRSVAEAQPLAGYTRGQVVDLMVGRAHASVALGARTIDRSGTPALEAHGDLAPPTGHRDVITAALRPGEILGIYGLVGAGRTELAKALLGLDRITRRRGAGARPYGADPRRRRSAAHATASATSPRTARRRGCSWSSRSRRNIGVTIWRRLAKAGLIPDRAERGAYDDYAQALVHPGRVAQAARRSALRWQPAEGEPGQVAGGRLRHPDHRRADGRHRRAHEGGVPRAHLEAGRPWHGDPADLVGSAGDRDARRPDRGDGRLRGRRASSPTTTTTTA